MEFDEEGLRKTCTGGLCAQYDIDRTIKASIFSSEEDAISNTPNEELLTQGDVIYTQQFDDSGTGESYANSLTYFSTPFNKFNNPSAVNYFEPGRGYFIQFENDLYLYWRLPS